MFFVGSSGNTNKESSNISSEIMIQWSSPLIWVAIHDNDFCETGECVQNTIIYWLPDASKALALADNISWHSPVHMYDPACRQYNTQSNRI